MIARILRSVALFMSLILCVQAQTSSKAEKGETPEDQRSFKDYVVKTYRDFIKDTGRFELYRNGELIHQQKNSHFYIGLVSQEDKEGNEPVAMGRDMTGKGIPNLLISEFSGGAHCCFRFFLFEIGEKFRKLAEIEAGHSELAYFKDLDGDRSLEFLGNDWTFAYWHTGFALSPAPQIILRFQDDRYVLSEDLMRKPAPSALEIGSKVQEIRHNESWRENEPPVDLWAWMLELIYSGQAGTAWEVFDKAWPEEISGKKAFLDEFRAKLATSPYWAQIKKMNRI